MEIHFIGQTTNNSNKTPNFGATKIDCVNLLKRVGTSKNYVPLKADFLELKVRSEKDISLLKRLSMTWGEFTAFTEGICNDFFDKKINRRFYAIQTVDEGEKKITGLMELYFRKCKTTNYKTIEIDYLQASPEIADKKDLSPIKGTGEIMLYEAAKMANENDFNAVSLYSDADTFYQHAGMENSGKLGPLSMFALTAEKFDLFIQRIAKKYRLNEDCENDMIKWWDSGVYEY